MRTNFKRAAVLTAGLSLGAGVAACTSDNDNSARSQKTEQAEQPPDITSEQDSISDLVNITASFVTFGALALAVVWERKTRRGAKKQEQSAKQLERLVSRIEHANMRLHFTSRVDMALSHVKLTHDSIDKGEEHRRRIGDFPEMLPYVAARLVDVKDTLVISSPFFLIALLMNPRGHKDLSRQIMERFSSKRDSQKLVIITSSDEERAEEARKFCWQSTDILRLLQEQAHAEAILDIFSENNKGVKEKLARAFEDYNQGLDVEDQDRIVELAAHPEKYSGSRKDKKLVQRMQKLRGVLVDVMVEVEGKVFMQDGGLWKNALIIKHDSFWYHNKILCYMIVCVDGKEIITGTIDENKPLSDHGNEFTSRIGREKVRWNVDKILEGCKEHEKVAELTKRLSYMLGDEPGPDAPDMALEV